MTVMVVGRDESLCKQTTCKHCGSILKYMPIDVCQQRTTDYSGGVDIEYFIMCPCCTRRVSAKKF